MTETFDAPAQPAVLLQRSPFVVAQPTGLQVKEGATIEQMAQAVMADLPAAFAPHLQAMIGEMVVAREHWATIRPKSGFVVTFRVVPQGKGGKNVLRIVIMVAVIAAASFYLGPTSALVGSTLGLTGASAAMVGAAFVTAATMAATLALNAIIPPPGLSSGSGADPRYSLTGTSNQFRPYAFIPRVFGKTRIYPLMAGRPYTEIVGQDQYLRIMLLAGYGPLRLSDWKLGETPLSAYSGITMEVHEGGPDGWAGNRELTVYSSQVREDQLSLALDPQQPKVQRTRLDTTEIQIDLMWPGGLVTFTKDGKKKQRKCALTVRYRPVAGGAWQNASWLNDYDPGLATDGQVNAASSAPEAYRITGQFTVPRGQYEVEINRTTPLAGVDRDGETHVDAVVWTGIRSVVHDVPVNMPGVTLIAMRMKASDQLNGVPQTINCIAESYLPVHGDNGWQYEISRSPAWAYADVIRRRGQEILVKDRRIDLAEIKAWAADCAAAPATGTGEARTFDGVIEGGSVFSAARQIASTGRANYVMRDAKFSIVRDIPQNVPVQHITPRNSWGYTGTKIYLDRPHCLRVRFKNEEKGYAEDEILVFDDGFDETNATKFEVLDLTYGCTRADMAWREGRYHFACGVLRPETHTVSMDVEALRCTMGSRVQLTHDVILTGLGYGRVKNRIAGNDGRIIAIELDNQVPMENGKQYSLRVRHSDGTSSIRSVVGPGFQTEGFFQSVTFKDAPEEANTAPDDGDLFMFGETGKESAPCIVKSIEPGPDLSCRLTLLPYDPAVYTAETAPIPAFTSYITRPPKLEQLRPAAPRIAVRSGGAIVDILQDGSITHRMAVDITPAGASPVSVEYWETRFRADGDESWRAVPPVPVESLTIYCEPVRAAMTYDVEVRPVSRYGIAGDWVAAPAHTVAGKTTPPDQPTLPQVSAAFEMNCVRWVDPVDLDLRTVRILHSHTNDYSTATLAGEATGGAFDHVNLTPGVRIHYWLLALDRSGNAALPRYAGYGDPLAIGDYVDDASDGILTGSEKRDASIDYAALNGQVEALYQRYVALGGDALPQDKRDAMAAALNARSALHDMLASINPSWVETTVPSAIDRAIYVARWQEAYQRTNEASIALSSMMLWKDVFGAGRPEDGATVGMTDAERTAYEATAKDIANVVSDNVLARGSEKLTLLRIYDDAIADSNAAHAQSVALVAQYGGDPTYAERVARDTANDALIGYLNSLSPDWTRVDLDTPADGFVIRARFSALRVAVAALNRANEAFIAGRAKVALDQIVAIGSDAVLSRGEKPEAVIRWQELYGEVDALRGRFDQLGQPAEVLPVIAAMIEARGALNAYLASLDPNWADATSDTPISAATWSTLWQNALASKATARAKMIEYSAKTAQWDGVGNKPYSRLFTNLLDTMPWVVDAADTFGRFIQNGVNGTQYIELKPAGPSGVSEPALRMEAIIGRNDGDGDPAGGWNYTLYADRGEYDHRKTYRHMAWVWREPGATGEIYFGCGPALNVFGNGSDNPYFWVGTVPQPHKWYLIVGTLHGSAYRGPDSGTSGLYDPETGLRVSQGIDWRAMEGAATSVHRAYQFYSQKGSVSFFARPSLEEVTAATISVEQIFATVGMTSVEAAQLAAARNAIEAIGSDAVLSKGEKDAIIREYNAYVADVQAIHSRFLALGGPADVEPAVTQVIAARDALSSMLASIHPAWNDVSSDSPIDSLIWKQRWNAAYDKLSIARAAITGRKGDKGDQGAQGVPGVRGADGTTWYPYYAYANSADGTVDFTTGAPEGRAYVGFANGTSPTEPENPSLYAWSQYRGPPFGMAGDGVSIAGTQIIKTSPVHGWTAQAYSTVGYRGGATATGRPGQTTGASIMFGLNADPNASASYETLDYAWFFAFDGNAYIYEGGAQVQAFGGYSADNSAQVTYDGRFVRYYIGGSLAREVAAPPGLTLYFDSTLYEPGGRILDVGFSAAGAAGADGANGVSALSAYLTNETFSHPTNAAGLPHEIAGGIGNGQMRVFLGTQDVTGQCTFTAQTPYMLALTVDASGAYQSQALYMDSGYAIVVASYQGQTIAKRVTATKAKAGSNGQSPPQVIVQANAQAILLNPDGSLAQNAGFIFNAIRRNTTADVNWTVYDGAGTPHRSHTGEAYGTDAANLLGIINYPNAIGQPNTRFCTVRAVCDGAVDDVTIIAVQNGAQGIPGTNGTNGTPGRDGIDGRTTYTHLAYANSADGTLDFTTGAADGRYFIGIYRDYSEPDSGNPASYFWSQFRGYNGNDGIPGRPGADGRPSYTHFAYANSPNGQLDFTTDDAQALNRRYIGIYENSVQADSQDPAAYTWSISRGADGAPGAPGTSPFALDLGAAAIVVAATFNGQTKPGQLPRNVAVSVKQGTADAIGAVAIGVSTSSGIAASYANGLLSVTQIDGDGYVEVSASQGGVNVTAPKRIAISRNLDAPPPSTATGQTITGFNGDQNSTSYLAAPSGRIATVQVPANGVMPVSAYAEYSVAANFASGVRSYAAAFKIVYRPAGGSGAWSDLLAEVIGSTATWTRGTEEYEPGEMSLETTVNMSANTSYEFALMARKYSGNGEAQYIEAALRIGV